MCSATLRGSANEAHGEGAIAIEIESIKEKMRGGTSPFIYLTLSSLHWLAKGRVAFRPRYQFLLGFSISKFLLALSLVTPCLFHDLLSQDQDTNLGRL